MSCKSTLLSFFLVTVVATSISAKTDKKTSKFRLAILNIRAKEGFSQPTADILTHIIRTKMVNTRMFIIIEKENVDLIFKEQSLSLSGCIDSACSIRIGKLLSADKILVGTASRIGKKIHIQLKITDVSKGRIEISETGTSVGVDNLEDTAHRLVRRISARLSGVNEDEIVVYANMKRWQRFWRSAILPGWGQLSEGYKFKGRGFIIATAIVLPAYLYSYAIMDRRRSDYRMYDASPFAFLTVNTPINPALPYLYTQLNLAKKREVYVKAANRFNISWGALVSLWIINIIDVIFFSEKSASAEYRNIRFEIAGNLNNFLSEEYTNRKQLSESDTLVFCYEYRF